MRVSPVFYFFLLEYERRGFMREVFGYKDTCNGKMRKWDPWSDFQGARWERRHSRHHSAASKSHALSQSARALLLKGGSAVFRPGPISMHFCVQTVQIYQIRLNSLSSCSNSHKLLPQVAFRFLLSDKVKQMFPKAQFLQLFANIHYKALHNVTIQTTISKKKNIYSNTLE